MAKKRAAPLGSRLLLSPLIPDLADVPGGGGGGEENPTEGPMASSARGAAKGKEPEPLSGFVEQNHPTDPHSPRFRQSKY